MIFNICERDFPDSNPGTGTVLSPVAVKPDERVAVARRIANRWRLIGYGNIVSFA